MLILPAYLEEPPLSFELDVLKSLHQIIKLYSKGTEKDNVALASVFFKLLYAIDTQTRNSLGIKMQSTNYYIKKIDYLISSRYSQKLTLNSVAAELNISPFYLSGIYKEATGINFSQQLLNVRMKQAERLLINQNIPTAKVAELCGFSCDSYFRKKFKQFFGLNVKEYRQIKNGMTLYHEKPERK